MSQIKSMNQGQSFEKQLLSDISLISPLVRQKNKPQSSVVEVSPFEEVINFSILKQFQQIRKNDPELTNYIDEYNRLRQNLLDLVEQKETNLVMNGVFYFQSQQDEKEIKRLQSQLFKENQQWLEVQKQLSKAIQAKNKLINELEGKQQVTFLIDSISQQNLTKINNNQTNIDANININFFTQQEQQQKDLYRENIKKYLQTLINKQEQHNIKIDLQQKNLKERIKQYELGIKVKHQKIMKERKQNEVRLTLDQIQNYQKALQQMNIWIMRIKRQITAKQQMGKNKKTFKRK